MKPHVSPFLFQEQKEEKMRKATLLFTILSLSVSFPPHTLHSTRYIACSPRATTTSVSSAIAEAYKNWGTAYADDKDEKARGHYEEGKSYLGKGQLGQAIAAFKEALKINPKYAAAYKGLGVAYTQMGQYDEAIANFNEAERINPKDAEVYNNRGIAYKKKDQFDDAIADYTRALEINPKFAGAYFNRGLARHAKEEYDKAIEDFNEAQKFNPEDAGVYNGRGSAYLGLDQYDQALSDFNKALEIDHQYANAYYNRGLAYYGKKEWEKALENISRAQELGFQVDPTLLQAIAQVFHNSGLGHAKKNNIDQAISDFKKVLEIDPKYATAYYNLGLAYFDKGELEKALENVRKAEGLGYKANPEFFDELAQAYFKRGGEFLVNLQYDKAIADYTQAFELAPLAPRVAGVLYGRASAYRAVGKNHLAIADYTILIERDPKDFLAYKERACAYYDMKDYENAWKDVKTIRSLGHDVDSDFLQKLQKASGRKE